jgi:hypothetical protein
MRARSRFGRRPLFFLATTILLLGTACLFEGFRQAPPLEAFIQVDSAIREAGDAEAERYEPDLYAIATRLRRSAGDSVTREARRFRWMRQYAGTRDLLVASRSLAVTATRRSRAAEASEGERLGASLDQTARALQTTHQQVEVYPQRSSIRRSLSQSGLLHARAVEAFRAGDLVEARELLGRADSLLARAQSQFQREFGGYFASSGSWTRLAREEIGRSRASGSSLILVDKMRRRCHLYAHGKRVATYAADLGPNWVGDKVMSGDKATPEGSYRVTEKRANGQTKYYKALLIDYPNDQDRAQFAAAKRAGRVPKSARIGGLIEVHGDGGRGYDWTLGCVALSNRDMDHLDSRVSVGTPVVIVGTLSEDLAGGNVR